MTLLEKNFRNSVCIWFVMILLGSSSCATIFTGTRDRINFDTNPSGAIVYINGIEECRTPCSVNVKRSINDTDAEFKLDGYQTRVITLSKEFNLVSIINLGNLLGWGIDAVSGALMRYDKRSYEVTLEERRTTLQDAKIINIDTYKQVVDFYVIEE